MGLLTPSGGLLFWMTLAFAVVFFVLAKFAFPAILGSVKKREQYIDTQLDAARAAIQNDIAFLDGFAGRAYPRRLA